MLDEKMRAATEKHRCVYGRSETVEKNMTDRNDAETDHHQATNDIEEHGKGSRNAKAKLSNPRMNKRGLLIVQTLWKNAGS